MIHACTGCLVFSAKRSLLQACDRSSHVRSHGSGTQAPWESGRRPHAVVSQATPPLRAPRHVPTDARYGRRQVLLLSAILWSILLLESPLAPCHLVCSAHVAPPGPSQREQSPSRPWRPAEPRGLCRFAAS